MLLPQYFLKFLIHIIYNYSLYIICIGKVISLKYPQPKLSDIDKVHDFVRIKGGVVGAVVRSLPSNHKVPSSNPGPAEC